MKIDIEDIIKDVAVNSDVALACYHKVIDSVRHHLKGGDRVFVKEMGELYLVGETICSIPFEAIKEQD